MLFGTQEGPWRNNRAREINMSCDVPNGAYAFNPPITNDSVGFSIALASFITYDKSRGAKCYEASKPSNKSLYSNSTVLKLTKSSIPMRGLSQ